MQKKHRTPQDSPKGRPKFRAKPHSSAYQPGIDETKFNQLVDELQVEEFIRKSKSR